MAISLLIFEKTLIYVNHLSLTSPTYSDTLQLIADILSFEIATEDLNDKLHTSDINWEHFVSVASDHLVLTTVYCRLKQRKLLDAIPKDLDNFLEEMTAINRNRNLALVEEAKCIAEIFESNNINYVFLKGTAMLICEYYQDFGERMVGDIDILVAENHIYKAFDSLQQNGYSKLPSGLRATFFEHKHLDRLTKKDGLCAVELHKYVLNKPVKRLLVNIEILNAQVDFGNLPVPNKNDLFIHNILNFQINDKAHYYSKISMRSAYDTIVLLASSPELLKHINNPYIRSYISLISIFFKKEFKTLNLDQSKIKTFESRLKSPQLNSALQNRLRRLDFIKLLPSRIWLFLKNKHYRFAIYKNRKRIIRELKSKFTRS